MRYELPKLNLGIGDAISDWFYNILSNIWNFIEGSAYWVALIIGVFALLAYIATGDKQQRNTVVLCILGFLFIKVVGGALLMAKQIKSLLPSAVISKSCVWDNVNGFLKIGGMLYDN